MTGTTHTAAATTHASAQQSREVAGGEPLMMHRDANVRVVPNSLNEQDRTVDMVISTGARVRRWDWDGEYDEVLNISPTAVRLGRLNRGAPLLDTHDYYSGTLAILGAVVPGTARVEGGNVVATAKFSKSEAGQRAWQDVKDGILNFVSVGYRTLKSETDETTTPETRTATLWEPYEVSCVPMPADEKAGFRSLTPQRALPANTGVHDMTTGTNTGDQRTPEQRAAAEAEATRVANANAAAEATRLAAAEATRVAAAAAAAAATTATPVNVAELTRQITESVTSAMAAQSTIAVAAAIRTANERVAAIRGVASQIGLGGEFAERHITENTPLDRFRELAITERARLDAERPTNGTGRFGSPEILPEGTTARKPEPGEMAARMLRCMAASKKSHLSPMDVARQWNDPKLAAEMQRAMSASIAGAGGVFIPEVLAAEVIELLRPMAIVRSLNPRTLPMPQGNMSISRIAGGATAGYVGENAPIIASELDTDAIKLSAKKLAALVPVSNDLLRFSSPRADLIVRDDMVAAIANAEDRAFLRGAGTSFTPKGIRNWANTDNVTAANATVNLANTNDDLKKLLNFLTGEDSNCRMLRPAFIFSWRTRNYLYSLLNSNGFYVYRGEMNTGKLEGFPFGVTNNVPSNLGGGSDESEITLADMADVVIGEVPGFAIDTSSEATYNTDDTTLKSAFSQDQTVIRVIEEHDLAVRHDRSIGVLTAVKWN